MAFYKSLTIKKVLFQCFFCGFGLILSKSPWN